MLEREEEEEGRCRPVFTSFFLAISHNLDPKWMLRASLGSPDSLRHWCIPCVTEVAYRIDSSHKESDTTERLN